MEAAENPFGFLDIPPALPRRQVLQPGGRQPSLIFSLSLSDILASSPSSLRDSSPLQSNENRAGGRCDFHTPQGLLRRRPVQRGCGKNCGPGLYFDCGSHRPGLGLARTVERVVAVGDGTKGTKEI